MKIYATIVITLIIALSIAFNIPRNEEVKPTFYQQDEKEKAEDYVSYVLFFFSEYRQIQLKNPLNLNGSSEDRVSILKGVNERKHYLETFSYNKDLIPEDYMPFQIEIEAAIKRKIEGIDIVIDGVLNKPSDARIGEGLRIMYFADSKLREIEYTIKSKIIEL